MEEEVENYIRQTAFFFFGSTSSPHQLYYKIGQYLPATQGGRKSKREEW
jgi:hypothetical protein